MSEFRMPSLGADMEAGTLVEWMKQPGDRVRRGDTIAAVETQKGAIEIEVYEDGVLDRILVQIGERVPVGSVLALIRGEEECAAVAADMADSGRGESTAAPAPPTIASAAELTPEQAVSSRSGEPSGLAVAAIAEVPMRSVGVKPPVPALTTTTSRAWISPAARRRAQTLGIDLESVSPAADGIIGLRELEARHAVAATAVVADRADASRPVARSGLDMVEMRRAIAAAMQRSWREIPHYYVSATLDLEPLLTWLEQHNARCAPPQRLIYAAPLIKAVAVALSRVPVLNGHYDDLGPRGAEHVHLGVAIAMRGGGLIAPVLTEADRLSVDQTMARLDDLVARVRGGRLRSSELTMSTATLTNLGEGTADSVQPLIYPPQVAIIGCGQIVERVWVQDRALSVRRCMTVTVGGDHRASDGRSGSRFLVILAELLRQPERL